MSDSDALNRGRSVEELTKPRLIAMPPPDILDGTLLKIEERLRSSVPPEIRKRIGVSRNLAVYGAFCYDFVAVSVFWSLTCVEMALWEKFTELNPGPLVAKKKGFRSLVNWAIEQRLVPSPEPLDAMIRLRNSFAHPKESSPVLLPGMAVTIFQRTVEVVNHLWQE
jgi:hypothetical protein